MRFNTKNWHDNHATIRLGNYPDGSTKLTVLNRYRQIICDATICLQGTGEYPAEGRVFIREWGDTEGVLRALRNAGVIGATERLIHTGQNTRDPLIARPVHECQLLNYDV